MESAAVRYLRTRCFCIRNLTRSLRSLVRFLIRQQLVRKYRTSALSMKYSLYTINRFLFLYIFMPIRITRNSILKYITFVIKAAKRYFIQLVAANLLTLTFNCAHAV